MPASAPKTATPFLTDVKTLRARARKDIADGALTPNYKGDAKRTVAILQSVLATELVCVLRYRRHYFMASGIHGRPVADKFLENANEEQGHADMAAERIVQLGGEPNFDPTGLAMRSHSEYAEGKSLLDMIREDLVAERIAVESYTEIIRYLGDDDPTTRTMMERIMGNEEEHAEEMNTLLESLGKSEAA